VVAPLRRWLSTTSTAAFSAYAIAAAFTAYFSMYAFRKPFSVALYEGDELGAISLKIALVIAQVVGYALSKFLSIKYVSEISPRRRAVTLVALIGCAELALLAFAVLPPAGKVVAIFCNGLPLGAIWGLVYGFLEGRRTSEILGAGLSTSYIVASGAVKSVGKAVLLAGVSESWMPVVVGLLFAPSFLLATWLLRQLPPPSERDEEARTPRRPMFGRERRAFVARFGVGLACLTALYMLLTAYRDFRDNFAVEIWTALGWGEAPAIFTASEVPVAIVVMIALALVYRIRGNRTAFFVIHALMAGGTVLIGAATLTFDLGLVGPVVWMVAVGMGLYLGYVPYGCVLFDRLIAATGAIGTAVFMIYVTDAFGYLGSIGLLLIKNFTQAQVSWLAFFRMFSYATSILCTAAFAASAWYFADRTRPPAETAGSVPLDGNDD
jgi:MFS family permease